uniref:Uncharacterized protein n=1 Tax=Vitis vinifera TaxID=29760 RepID=A5BYQ8_VITVI|nr:hypothetical protein VITISV_043523 [Vitis vinifera]
MSLVHGSLDSRSGGMCSCRRCKRAFAKRSFNGGFPTWIWARRRDRTPLLNPSSIVWLDTQKKNKCYDNKNNVEKPHDSLGDDSTHMHRPFHYRQDLRHRRKASLGDLGSLGWFLMQKTRLCKLWEASGAISQEKNGVCEISQTPKRAAKLFRNTELSSQGCEVGFHLEVPSSLLAAWFVNRQKEKHLTVQKCCEITSQQKGDFATLCKMLPSARSDWLVMAATSSFQLRIAHRLKHWIVDFLSFEMFLNAFKTKSVPKIPLNKGLIDGLPMQGQDSVTILSMFHDILEKETPFVVLMVTKGWRIGKQWVEGNGLLRQSLHAGLVPPSGPSSCTHIPRQRGGRCTLNEINIGGRVGLAPPAFPNFVIDVAVASVA